MFKRALAVFSAAVITAMIFSCGSEDPTGPVSTVPNISTQPQPVTATAGEQVTFFVGASGYPAISYQWRKDGIDIPGAVEWQYVIPGVSPLDAGEYTVVVTNAKGIVISTAAALTVQSVPSIITNPAWHIGVDAVDEGDPVTFTVVAAGNPPITKYEWWRNGGFVDTTTTGSYTINTVNLSDGGEWFVVVENYLGRTSSGVFYVEVNQLYFNPLILLSPQSATVNNGEPVSFTVSATGGSLTYQWYNITGLIPGANDSVYSITSVTLSDSGIYFVVVSNPRGSSQSAFATLTVNKTTFAPTITTQPQSATVIDGDSVSFSVVATGNPAPVYQWSDNVGVITGANASTYTINPVATSHAGIYYVAVSNSEGGVQSSFAYLTVNPRAPTITTPPLSQSVDEKGTVTLSVIADGTAPLNYQWRLDGTPIPGADSADYTIDTVRLDDAGQYTVRVTNSAGSVTSTAATLTVNQVCPALLSPADGAINISSTPTLRWEAYPGAVSYQIEVGTTPDVSTGFVEYNPLVTDTTYTLTTTLNPTTLYYWHVVANDGTGNPICQWSWIWSFTTGSTTLTAPTITDNPDDASVADGASVTFSVAANGNPAPDIQWQLSDNGGTTWTDTGAIGASLTFIATIDMDGGMFRAIATNSEGSDTSLPATLRVTAAPSGPTITTHPVGSTVTEGDAWTFTVAATGNGTLLYQWQLDGTDIGGATSVSYAIASAVLADDGDYTVVVTDDDGSVTSNAATLTVNPAASGPTITTHPVGSTVTEGDAWTFTVAATGNGTLLYQWQLDGTDIGGATSVSYAIASAVLADDGDYTVVVTDDDGSVTSNAATLTVNPAASGPTITTHPVGSTVTEGDAWTFTVAATGNGTLLYQWQLDGTDIGGATSVSYAIASAVLADDGDYTVVVTDDDGSVTSNAATLTVNPAASGPTITTQPVGSTVTEGDAWTFTVAATGNGTLLYQWQLDGTDIGGATSVSYAITSAVLADDGDYTVVVTDDDGSVTSNAATLTVNPAASGPTITTHPVGSTVTEGDAWTFTVAATGNGTLLYQWQLDGTDIGGATSVSYAIASAVLADDGDYTVVVTDDDGSVTSNAATLTVNPAASGPTITTHPVGSTVTEGDAWTFTVAATGNGTLLYQWQLDGTDIGGATSVSYAIASAVLADDGDYTVVVTDDDGSVTSNAATLTVNPAASGPTITTQPVGSTVTEGDAWTFTVAATGNGTLLYQWQLDGTDIGGATSYNYAITSAVLADDGDYTVVVTDDDGSVTSNAATLVVNPAQISITTQPQSQAVLTGNPVTLTVVASGHGTLHYQWYLGSTPVGTDADNYVIASAGPADEGDYTVVITDDYAPATDVTSDVATLALAVAPAITTDLADTTTALNNSSITLSVVVTGTPEPTYHWWLSTDGGGSFTFDLGTTLTPDLTYGPVAIAMTGWKIRVEVANMAGNVTSAATTLVVN